MKRAILIYGCVLLAALEFHSLRVRAAQAQNGGVAGLSLPSKNEAHAQVQAGDVPMEVLHKYCVTCHNDKLKTGGLSLGSVDSRRVGDDAAIWEKVVNKLRTHEMPPAGLPRPDSGTYNEVVKQLETALDAAAAVKPNAGQVPVHRLNRTEYANAIRDLLNLEIDSHEFLSTDVEDQEGFDNVASVLSISPALLEDYLSAARIISRLAVGDKTINAGVEIHKISRQLIQDERMGDELPMGSQGGTAIRHFFPVDGEYSLKVLLRREEYDYILAMGEPHQVDFRLDGVLVKRFSVGGEGKGPTMPETFGGNTPGGPEFEHYIQHADDNLEVRVPVKAGEHTVGISFVRRYWEPEGVSQPPLCCFGRVTDEYFHGYPGVEKVYIGGPYGNVASGESATRRKIFICSPTNAASEESCATKILTTLARRAYRRPLTDPDIQTLVKFYRAGRAEGSFDIGVMQGLERILVSPSFLFRVEGEPEQTTAGLVPLSSVDLASRLSFFIWGSIPDDELLNAAIEGSLKDPEVVRKQVQRMLRDSRSKALVDGFATRWLELNKLPGLVPDLGSYPEFDENLRDAMKQETLLFVGNQISDDRSVIDLLTANYTFLNDRLATHYGIPNIYGSNFRKVTLPDDSHRGGLLGQASVLAVTSYPTRTSPTIRGRWLLANMLGSPPPPPPPDVDTTVKEGAGLPKSFRARMELHRKNQPCASCHSRMDPMGFSLDNFDALGKWRTESDGVPIDTSAFLPDGTKFDGFQGVRALLAEQKKEDFVRTLGEKLLAWATGRGVEYYDMPAVRKIARDAAASDYRWSSMILGVVTSPSFTMEGGAAPTKRPVSDDKAVRAAK